jgi:hypothetical protein
MASTNMTRHGLTHMHDQHFVYSSRAKISATDPKAFFARNEILGATLRHYEITKRKPPNEPEKLPHPSPIEKENVRLQAT